MKIIHSVSGQVIDVPPPHAEMLKRQGWKDHVPDIPSFLQGAIHETQETEVPKDAAQNAETGQNVLNSPKRRGRPPRQ